MGPQGFCAKTCHETVITKPWGKGTWCPMAAVGQQLLAPQSSVFPTELVPAPLCVTGYSQPLIEPHFTHQWLRHPMDEGFGLLCHVRLGASHLQLHHAPTGVLGEKWR